VGEQETMSSSTSSDGKKFLPQPVNERQSTDRLCLSSSAISTGLPWPISFMQLYSVKVYGLFLFKYFKDRRT
jgi:hypothetical protein